MITINLKGGLGNQLFQYATGRALSLKNSDILYLNISTLKSITSRDTKRFFSLNFFDYSGVIINDYLISLKKILSVIFGIFFTSIGFKSKIIIEVNGGYSSDVNSATGDISLIGYWQSYKYFYNYSNTIFKELDSHKPLSSSSKSILLNIIKADSVAIHVRRGDYVSLNTANNFHGSILLDYYINAISIIDSKINAPLYFIFSDDLFWCRENLSLKPGNFIFVDNNINEDAWQDLILMSYCKHHIIANSSFSWWGAWMADQRFGLDRMVFAPKRWFIDAEVNAADRFPPHWVLV